MRVALFALVALLVASCGSDANEPAAPTSSGAPPAVLDGADTPEAADAPTSVTLGFFSDEAATEPAATIEFAVGVTCDRFERQTRKADAGSDEVPHTHYNAADEITFVDGVLRYVEYGPAHSADEIEATCAAGVGGTAKSANVDTFTDDKGLFVKVVSTN